MFLSEASREGFAALSREDGSEDIKDNKYKICVKRRQTVAQVYFDKNVNPKLLICFIRHRKLSLSPVPL